MLVMPSCSQRAWRARQTNVSGQVLWHIKSQSPERAQTFAACGMRQLVSCCLKGNQKPLEPQAPTSDSFLKNSAETLRLHHAFDPSLHPGPVRPTEKTNHQAIMWTNEQEPQRSISSLLPTLAACGMCQLVRCCHNASEPLEPLKTNFRWPLQNLHHALDSTSHSGPLRPTEIANHQAIMSTNEQEPQVSDSILEPKDRIENPRVNAKLGSTALKPLPCCARRRCLRALNHAGWQSSLKAHGRCARLICIRFAATQPGQKQEAHPKPTALS